MKRLLFFSLFSFGILNINAQNIDSLMLVYKNSNSDSVKVACASMASELCDEDKIKDYVQKTLSVISKVKNKNIYFLSEEAKAYNNLGFYNSYNTQYLDAIDNYLKAIAILEKNNIVNQDINSSVYNNLAVIYMKLEKYDLAKLNFRKSLAFDMKLGLETQITLDYNNLATLYSHMDLRDSSIYYYKKSLPGSLKMDKKKFAIVTLGNLSEIYYQTHNIDSSRHYSMAAFKLFEDSKTKLVDKDLYIILSSKLKLLIADKKYKEAEAFVPEIEKVAKGNSYNLEYFYSILKDLYINTSNHKKALEASENYFKLKESITGEEIKNKGELKLLQTNFEIKEAVTKATEEQNLEIEKNKRQNLIYFMYGGILFSILILVFGLLFYKRYKVTLRQKSIIEKQSEKLGEQHFLLEEKNKEITDSITYSKEIQNAFIKLPYNKKIIKESHVFFNPKDIVSGDFYWTKQINNLTFVVVGDCTGHGVSGAFITMYAIQALETSISKLTNLTQLHELNELLRTEFDKHYHSGGLVNIGLDYTLVCFNENDDAIYVTGSSNTAIIKTTTELKNEKFDSINIGGKRPAIYNGKTSVYNKKDVASIYLYTDGVVDQKGGTEHKKFSTKQLQQLILNNTINVCNTLKTTMEIWKEKELQTDDITFLELIIT